MEEPNYQETRASLTQLLDYEAVFYKKKSMSDIAILLHGIPSVSLLIHIASINQRLYLNDTRETGQQMQNEIIKSFFVPGSDVLKKIIETYTTVFEARSWPIIFYRYSNLLFYESIFSTYNSLPFRELTTSEMENMVKAYLIINGQVNSRITIDEQEISTAVAQDTIEEVLLPNFIYQNDYRSNVDFSNQFTRAVRFFSYLDKHIKYGPHMAEFYRTLKVKTGSELIFKLATIFTGVRNGGSGTNSPVFSMQGVPTEQHNQLLMQLAIDPTAFDYHKDDSFRQFRNQMLVLLPNTKLLLLDISFLIDFFYKTHVFSLSKFFEKRGLTNFLADKSIEFTEQIYLCEIMERCFPCDKKYPGKKLIKKNGEELTDFIVSRDNYIITIEFKDTILNSKSKNSGRKDTMFDALDMKFLEDEGPKGITQLLNAIKYLDNRAVSNLKFPFQSIEIVYPVIIYTDNAFGFDGINKIYKEKFRQLLSKESICSLIIKDVTFINLSFFEINENLLKSGELDMPRLIELYHQHTSQANFLTVPFEVFATSYRNETIVGKMDSSDFFKEMVSETRSQLVNGFGEMGEEKL